MASQLAAYNPDDPLQASFLSALALGETGGAANAYSEGTGGADLSGASVDPYGFPQWSGEGSSHAAGAFQFQPSTWDSVASEYNLNFAHPADQNAGAWYLAEQTYAAQTGGQSLEGALQSGSPGALSAIQTALAKVWPSVAGNAATRGQGLASVIAAGGGAPLAPGAASSGAGSGTGSSGQSGASQAPADFLNTVESFFVRSGLLVAGAVIVVVALWQLLASGTGNADLGPAAVAKGAVRTGLKTARKAGAAVAAA